jgi:3-methyladenine DNA glycosylase AlkD
MTADEILQELESLGGESYKKLMMKNYGVREPCFGVKIGDMKKIQKRIKKDYQLALDLYDTGNYDAMYLAGLIADPARMTKKDLKAWAKKAYAGSLPSATVAWTAAESRYGCDLALDWIDSPKELVAAAGWATLSSLVAIKEDEDLDLIEIKQLLQRVKKEILDVDNAVRYEMNGFVIATGCYVKSLTNFAIQTGEKIGPVLADLGDNACEIPYAPDYIRKVQSRSSIGKKRKTAKC